MATANPTINPYLTTTGQGLFTDPDTKGLVQGTAYPDPAVIFQLRTGTLAAAETIPMWGGVGVYEFIPGATGTGVPELGPVMGRATAASGAYPLAGFSVFDQAYGMFNSPQSQVPLAGSTGQVLAYRLGSGARIALACDPGLVSLQGSPISSPVAWDYVNQILIPAVGATAVSSGTYNTVTGLVTLTMASAIDLSPGDSVTVSAATGTGSFAAIDGTFTAAAGTGGSTVTYFVATGLTMTITGGSLTTGPALAGVNVLDVMATGCMTVEYAPSTGFATWNYDGACAVVQI